MATIPAQHLPEKSLGCNDNPSSREERSKPSPTSSLSSLSRLLNKKGMVLAPSALSSLPSGSSLATSSTSPSSAREMQGDLGKKRKIEPGKENCSNGHLTVSRGEEEGLRHTQGRRKRARVLSEREVSQAEDEKMQEQMKSEPLPTRLAVYKTHPQYCLEQYVWISLPSQLKYIIDT